MLLETVTEQGKSLLYMERWVDEGAKTYSPFAARTDVEPQYQPGRGNPSFDLVTVRVPKEIVSIFQATPPATLSDWYIREEDVLFAVHPETWTDPGVDHLDRLHRLPRDEPIVVAPTASTRTVLTLEHASKVSPHFIKLHLPRRISRFNRRLRRKNIENSVALSRDVAHIHLDRFAYLPDALGFAIGEDDSSWGFLVRERFPRPSLGPRPLIPCFALYAGDLNCPQDPPLLVQMIEKFGAEIRTIMDPDRK